MSAIDLVHRVPAYSRSTPKPTIVRFVTRRTKENILRKLRSQKKRVPTNDSGVEGPELSIFINEHLTQIGETLARRATNLKRSKKILYTWVRNANVFI